jgi:hypothetical protein
MFSVVLDPTNSRMLDNTTEPIYGGFYSTPQPVRPFTITNNTGSWQLGGDTGEFYNGTTYCVLMYSTELANANIQQNVTAVQAIMTARNVPARTDGNYSTNILDCEGTSIEVFGAPSWCLGMTLTSSPSVLTMAGRTRTSPGCRTCAPRPLVQRRSSGG